MKILLFYHSGSYNRGCEAIVRTAVAEIKTQFQNAIIDVASFNPETDAVIKPLVNNIISQKPIALERYSFNWFLASIYFKIFLVIIYAKWLAKTKKKMYNISKLIIYCHKKRLNFINSVYFSIEGSI